ncbi:NAD-dependent epimerase/dehydratase family protein [Nocardia terpenica]|uniref:NAD-dependent epimerase n=1 Tax=Nocardia terpenica TaxID=455432 RepID=A0A0U1Z2C7_9NOCA|nr:NAD-dependent epimerase/dehydratase [Nocardia terpenica]AJO72721.1 dTDP-4-keto-6-deoxy-hexose 4-ketoreductase [Nocardia terpenica]KZM75343.1 NAD-dependent epimerase [Nocardia terpenica]NQE85800.1 NAD-dependent epimerase/dehydratase [Nocardia terpenica]
MGASTVAVLGATGGVGRFVCAAFARAGYDVLAVARRYTAHVYDHEFAPLDVAAADPREIAAVLDAAGVSVVVNATGSWGRTEPELVYAHVTLIERLLAALPLLSRRIRLVHIGSIHEYGPVPAGTLIDETRTPAPTTAYARTKLIGSEAVLDVTHAGVVDGVVLRAVNVCGPGTTSASFLGAVVDKLRAAIPGEVVELTVADARRDFLDVRDLADAVVKAATAPAVGRAVNIGWGVAMSMRELVGLLHTVSGLPEDAVRALDAVLESKGGGGWTQADIRLAADLLGWKPTIGLSESLRDMWEAAAVPQRAESG